MDGDICINTTIHIYNENTTLIFYFEKETIKGVHGKDEVIYAHNSIPDVDDTKWGENFTSLIPNSSIPVLIRYKKSNFG